MLRSDLGGTWAAAGSPRSPSRAVAGMDPGTAGDEPVYIDRSVTETVVGPPTVEQQVSGTEALLIGVSPVNNEVAWVSGTAGTYLRTVDGGAMWTAAVVPGADSLQFRDVHASSADEAWLLSAGSGDASRIYHTSDAGATWTLQWTNPEADGFYDCLDFWDTERGVPCMEMPWTAVSASCAPMMEARPGAASQRRLCQPAGDGEGGFRGQWHVLRRGLKRSRVGEHWECGPLSRPDHRRLWTVLAGAGPADPRWVGWWSLLCLVPE